MKSRILKLMPFLAAMTLAGCASEEPISDETGSSGGNNLNYMAVNIVQPKNLFGRADDNDKWEQGAIEENLAKKAIFCIFNEEGEFYDVSNKFIEVKFDGTSQDQTTGPTEKIYKGLVVINKSKENPGNKAKKMVCILNMDIADLENNSGITNLETLMSVVGDYENGVYVTDDNTKRGLVMSNSVYYGCKVDKDGNELAGSSEKYSYTPINEINLANSPGDAEKNPVNVYVERVVAKVRAHAKEDGSNISFTNTEGAPVVIDGNKEIYNIRITGIEVANIADKAYLGKHIPDNAAIGDYWNQKDNHRYNWEIMPDTKLYGYKNQSYKDIVNTDQDTNKLFHEYDIKTLTTTKPFSKYILPNTSDQKTSILVTAQLLYKNGDKAGQPVGTFVYLRGLYYPENDAKQKVANYLRDQEYYQLKEGSSPAEYETINPDAIKWAWGENDTQFSWLKDYEVVPQVKSGTQVYKKSKDTDGKDVYTLCTTLDDVNNLLKLGSDTSKPDPYYKARVFTDGMCYYFKNIEHDLIKATENGETTETQTYGVVRNHIYDLTLNSIKGLGVPVFDPEKTIIPENPGSDFYYLDASVTVLSWRLKTQTVDFSGN